MGLLRGIGASLPAMVLVGLSGCSALMQKHDEIVTRQPGHRTLGAPAPALDEAKQDLDFAWLADSAYGRTPAGEEAKVQRQAAPDADNCLEPEEALRRLGWTRWPGFPDKDLEDKIATFHLRAEVWVRKDHPAIAVTFGGTVVGSHHDLMANIRWFLPSGFLTSHPDEYSATVQDFAPRFADELRRKLDSSDPEWAFLKKAPLYSTGHSLGGGLAQQFAYAMPLDAPRRVEKVYAFDPSPVTGFYSVKEELRDKNRMGLLIDRIYERGEVLALLRSLTSFVKQPTAEDASIRGVRYSLFYPALPIGGHSISHLACGMQDLVDALQAVRN